MVDATHNGLVLDQFQYYQLFLKWSFSILWQNSNVNTISIDYLISKISHYLLGFT